MNNVLNSCDRSPWEHPYLTSQHISRFRSYSEEIWDFALNYYKNHPEPLDCAFTFNMAQSMYKWARLAQSYGTRSTLYLHEMDKFPFSQPEWEDYDGELSDLSDYETFRKLTCHIVPEVETVTVPINSEEFRFASSAFAGRNQNGGDPRRLLMILRRYPLIRYEVFDSYPALMSYCDWAAALTNHEVIYAGFNPFPAYASGVPYMAMAFGGDMEIDCGRGDYYGKAMTLAFNQARFLAISNPHVLGHSRRLGLTNGIYLPYPMDTSRYSPGEGMARKEWIERFGDGIFVLCSSRIDSEVKGQTNDFIMMLMDLAISNPRLKFIFLGWGANIQSFNDTIQSAGLDAQLIILPPVGKKRLIDYYRSADMVLDQLVYGYYGATALEAASVGKPIIMKIRKEHYSPLYNGDVIPVNNADTIEQLRSQIVKLTENEDERIDNGRNTRSWAVRTHGEQKTIPILQSLLRLIADKVLLPQDQNSPLASPLTDQEIEYHGQCLVASS